jgi:hypothetical protein
VRERGAGARDRDRASSSPRVGLGVSAAASERIDPIALEGRGVFVRGKKERDLADINANLIFAAMMPTTTTTTTTTTRLTFAWRRAVRSTRVRRRRAWRGW